MPTFDAKPLRSPAAARGGSGSRSRLSLVERLTPQVRRRPVLFFGLPFVLTIVAGSYGLSALTQTRYDYNATKVQSMSKEEELGMRKDRRRIDIREEYFVSGGLYSSFLRSLLSLFFFFVFALAFAFW